MNGSRSAATTGGRTALRTAITAATRNAAPGSLERRRPGTRSRATYSEAAAIAQETSRRSGRSRGFAGSHVTASPCTVVVTAPIMPCRRSAPQPRMPAAGYLSRVMPRFAVVGHVEWVDFLTVPRVPLAGEIVHADKWWSEAAGGGAVAAVQLAKLSGTATFFTALGNDDHARRAGGAAARSRGRGRGGDPRPSPAAGRGAARRPRRAHDRRAGRAAGSDGRRRPAVGSPRRDGRRLLHRRRCGIAARRARGADARRDAPGARRARRAAA